MSLGSHPRCMLRSKIGNLKTFLHMEDFNIRNKTLFFLMSIRNLRFSQNPQICSSKTQKKSVQLPRQYRLDHTRDCSQEDYLSMPKSSSLTFACNFRLLRDVNGCSTLRSVRRDRAHDKKKKIALISHRREIQRDKHCWQMKIGVIIHNLMSVFQIWQI